MNAPLRDRLAGAALVALAVAAYANGFHAGFVLDNQAIILGDPRLRAFTWDNVVAIFTRDYWWPLVRSELYRPLTTLSFLFNYALLGGGASPTGYHVVNVALHAANVVLLRRLALRVGAPVRVAWLAAALFAVHPVTVDAVTNIIGRSDLLATFGVLVTALAWLRAETATTAAAAATWRAAAGLVAFLAVFTKEIGVLAAVAVGLLVVWRHGWRRAPAVFLRQAAVVCAPALVATVAVRLAMRHYQPISDTGFTTNPIADAAAWPGFMTAVGVLGRYALLLVWPARLSCDYSYAEITPYGGGGRGDVAAWAALIALIAAGAWLWSRRAKAPLVAGAAAWGAIMLLPTSNLIVRIGTVMGERLLYLPLTGFAVVAAVALAAAGRRVAARPIARWALPAAVLAALTARTLLRNADWRDDLSFWTAAVEATPRSFRAHKGLAVVLSRRRGTEADIDAAIARAEAGLRVLESPPLPIQRQEYTLLTDAGEYYRIKGGFARARGDRVAAQLWFGRSLAALDRALAVDRSVNEELHRRERALGRPEAQVRDHGNARVLTQRALTLVEMGRPDAAAPAIRLLQLAAPLNVDAYLMLARIGEMNGDLDAAAVRLLEAVLVAPEDEVASRALASLYERLGLAPPGRRVLNLADPRVRRHLDAAFGDLVATMRAAKWEAQAREWAERGIRDYGCAPELFGR